MVAIVSKQNLGIVATAGGASIRVTTHAIAFLVQDEPFDLRFLDEINGEDDMFLDVTLPDNLARGSSGEELFAVDDVTVDSGAEQRISRWQHPRRAFDVGYAVQTMEQLQTLAAFWKVVRGKEYSFRFKDWSDYHSADWAGQVRNPITKDDQQIGIGDGTTPDFQLTKIYTYPETFGGGTQSYTRLITKPRHGSVLIAVDGVLQTETTDYAVDHATGVVTFVTAPAAAAVVSAGYEFDVQCRFDIDGFPLEHQFHAGGDASSIRIVEVRNEA
ncbi:MAG: phage distal tail protein, Rcc01695 family [Magnetospiraceae bacterium]